jgi:hypothetical protein
MNVKSNMKGKRSIKEGSEVYEDIMGLGRIYLIHNLRSHMRIMSVGSDKYAHIFSYLLTMWRVVFWGR